MPDTQAGSSSSAAKPIRRIVTSHSSSDTSGNDVILHDDTIPLKPVLGGQAHIQPFHAHLLPSHNPHVITSEDVFRDTKELASSGVVTPGGVNSGVTQLAPNFRIGMHRTNSIDYNVFIEGSAWLITPSVNADGSEKETRVLVKAGEVVVQRGTLHAWEAGPEGARWVSVIVAVEKGVEVNGKELEEVDF